MPRIPLKLDIQRRLSDMLRAIPETEDFPFDLTAGIFRGMEFGENSPAYFINIIEAPRQDPGSHAGDGQGRRNAWELYIQGYCETTDLFNPTDMVYIMAAGVEEQLAKLNAMDNRKGKPLYPEYHLLGYDKHIVKIDVGASIVRAPTKSTADTFFYQTLLFELAGEVGNPYISVD